MTRFNRPRTADRTVFAEWMSEHRGIIVKIVRSFTATPADSDDLTQEITLALWKSVPSFRGGSKPSTWIWRIALNRAISWQRAERPPSLDVDDTVVVSNLQADDGVMVDRIYQSIRTLNPIDRSLIVLWLEGYRYAEIAEITGMTESNVGARFSRARARLSQQLKEVQ